MLPNTRTPCSLTAGRSRSSLEEQLEADQLAAHEEDIASLQLMWFAQLPRTRRLR
jgi:hypothetical protein